MLTAALHYAAKGWPVFALAPNSKVPMTGTHGSLDATTDPSVINAMWRQCPRANVVIATTSLLVLDVDRYKVEGQAWLSLHADRLRGLTMTAKTPHGGLHFYFEQPAGELKGSVCRGVDLRRGPGHYAVAPPSTIADGTYRWIHGWPSKPIVVPPWLLTLCRRPPTPVYRRPDYFDERRAKAPAFQRAARMLDKCPIAISGSGGHNVTWFVTKRLVSCFGSVLREDELWILLSDWNSRCEPPWDEKELGHKLTDALRRRAA